MAQPHQREAAVPLQGLEQVEREVAGNAVDMADAAVPQSIEEELVQVMQHSIRRYNRETASLSLRLGLRPVLAVAGLHCRFLLHCIRRKPSRDVPTVLVSRQVAEEQGITVGALVQVAPPDGSRARRLVSPASTSRPRIRPAGRDVREVRSTCPTCSTWCARTARWWAPITSRPSTSRWPIPGRRGRLRPRRQRAAAGWRAPPATPPARAGRFRVLERFHLAIALVTIIAATVFLLALTIMLVDERRETVGVLRLIGLPAGRILMQIALEGLLVAGVGSRSGSCWPSRPKR